ncbi:MAG TPA: PorV/PorQ family protein [Gemmatimonadales bacterium]|nr:PorV/PorQ family protein [Gemmatimonadales bacterium]
MTRMIRRFAWAFAALPLAATPLLGQISLPSDNTAYGTTSAEFLLLGAGARGTALGGAYAALATDVSALYYNPAGVAQLQRPGAMVSSYSYVADTKYTWAGVALPTGGGARTFGLQVGSFGFSDQPEYTVEQPDGTGATYAVSETFIGATYAENFSDRFSAGFTGKIISDKLGHTSASAFAVDFGTSFHATAAGRPIRASFVIQNLGSTLKHTGTALDVGVLRPPVPGQVDVPQEKQPADFQTKDWGLPVNFRVGVALDAVSMEQTRVTVLSEFTQPNNTRAGFGIGAEVMQSDVGKTGFFVAGRASYEYQSDNNLDVGNGAGFATSLSSKENADGLAAGFGVGYKKGDFGLGVDYAYRSMGILQGTHMFSFSLSW